jgi:hypothetical protein
MVNEVRSVGETPLDDIVIVTGSTNGGHDAMALGAAVVESVFE